MIIQHFLLNFRCKQHLYINMFFHFNRFFCNASSYRVEVDVSFKIHWIPNLKLGCLAAEIYDNSQLSYKGQWLPYNVIHRGLHTKKQKAIYFVTILSSTILHNSVELLQRLHIMISMRYCPTTLLYNSTISMKIQQCGTLLTVVAVLANGTWLSCSSKSPSTQPTPLPSPITQCPSQSFKSSFPSQNVQCKK